MSLLHADSLDVSAESTKAFWGDYLDRRRGTYDFRCQRYDAVIERMVVAGLRPGDTVFDIGAGRCELARRLREWGLDGTYRPIDGALDGTDIETWSPYREAEFFVAIELLEHLRDPWRLMDELPRWASKGVVVTTPNPETVDVLAIDPTHRTPLQIWDFRVRDWQSETRSFFSGPADSILAWR